MLTLKKFDFLLSPLYKSTKRLAMKTLIPCILFIAFLCPVLAPAAYPSLGLRIRALRSAEAQYQIGFEYERYRQNIPKAKEFYLKAIAQEHPDAANQMAVLLEKEEQVLEAIAYHEKAVKWGEQSTRTGFAPLSGTNFSQYIFLESMMLEFSSPAAASALALAQIYRQQDHKPDYLSMTLEERIEQSHFWYNKAFRLQVPAVLIGFSLALLGEDEEALKWFEMEKALDTSEYKTFVHYEMGNSYKILKKYTEAVASYTEAMESKPQKKKDLRYAARAALKLARMHRTGIPEINLPADRDKSKFFYKRALEIGREGWKESVEKYLQTNLGPMSSLRKPIRNITQRTGVARFIAEDYLEAYLKHEETDDLKEAIDWYNIAHKDNEISSKKYQKALSQLTPQKKPPAKSEDSPQSELPLESPCEESWEKG